MPSLVTKTGNGPKGQVWEVRWTWMPYFLAADSNLVRKVDERLNKMFQGGDVPMERTLSKAVIKVVVKEYPMPGLQEMLESILLVDPTEGLPAPVTQGQETKDVRA